MTAIGPTDSVTGQRESYDPLRGDSFLEIHEGTEGAMRGIKETLRIAAPYLSVDIEAADEPLWRATIFSADDFSGPAQAVITWELWTNEINKSIYEHPNTFKAGVANVEAIKKAIKNNSTTLTLTGTTTEQEYALRLDMLLQKGVTDYLESQFVVRKTKIVSSKYDIKVAFTGIGSIWTGAALVNTEQPPAEILFSISGIPEPELPPAIDGIQLYRNGWLKKAPRVINTASNRFEIQQEWWLVSAAYYLYPNDVT